MPLISLREFLSFSHHVESSCVSDVIENISLLIIAHESILFIYFFNRRRKWSENDFLTFPKKIIGQRFSNSFHSASACRRRAMSDSSLVCWPRMKMLTLTIGGVGKLIFRGKKHRLETRVNNFFFSSRINLSDDDENEFVTHDFNISELLIISFSLCTLLFAPCGVSGGDLAVSNRTVDEASFVYEYQFFFFGKRLHREGKKKLRAFYCLIFRRFYWMLVTEATQLSETHKRTRRRTRQFKSMQNRTCH